MARRNGSIIVLVLVIVAIVTSLVLSIGAILGARIKILNDLTLRGELFHEACSAAALAAWEIYSDTNGVDHVGESWFNGFTIENTDVMIEDAGALLKFPDVDKAVLANLIYSLSHETERMELKDALAEASILLEWWSTTQAAHTNRVLAAVEELKAAPVERPDVLVKILPYLRVHGDEKININSVDREVFAALSGSLGSDAKMAGELFRNLERARGKGEFFKSLDISEIKMLLGGSGVGQSGVLDSVIVEKLSTVFCVESGLFKITATARGGATSATIQCLYERETGRILNWLEF